MKDEYVRALRKGRRAYQKAVAEGQYPFLPALDHFLEGQGRLPEVPVGILDIPLAQVVGTRTRGRQEAFAVNYMPMLDEGSEFSTKWNSLYEAQITEGIRDAVKVYEYMWRFYTLEGNKRVSVLKYLEVPTITADVTRIIPSNRDDPEAQLYFEFLEFFEIMPTYDIRFSIPGSYAKLAEAFGCDLKNPWPEETKEDLRSSFNVFSLVYEAEAAANQPLNMTTADAYLVYIGIFPYKSLIEDTRKDITAKVQKIWSEFRVESNRYDIDFVENPDTEKSENLLTSPIKKIISPRTWGRKMKIAFIYDIDPENSRWLYGHELGRNHLSEVFGDLVETKPYINCGTEEKFMEAVEDAIDNKCEMIITPSTAQMNLTLKAAVAYPKVKFLNCSVNLSTSAVISYYGRMYEAKFLMGALAASVSRNHRLGYVADYPIYGTVANINAFALGAALIDPYVEVHLAWSTLENKDWHQFMQDRGIRVVSGLDMIKPSEANREYGIFRFNEDGSIYNLAAPVWDWGRYYELIIKTILNESWPDKAASKEHALNYWWGMSAGVIDVILSKDLPFYSRKMVDAVRNALVAGTLNPFAGELHSQTGIVQEADSMVRLSNEEIVSMNWLNDNVVGSLPVKAALSESGKKAVQTSGVIKE